MLGFKTPRAFLEWLPCSGCPVIERGQDRLVRIEDAERAIEAMGMPPGELAEPPVSTPTELVSADDVLRLIGRRAS